MSKIKQAIGIMLFESDDFGGPKIVGGGICPTQRANKTCCGVIEVMEMADVKIIGQMDNTIDHTFESANRVYDVGGVAPTMNTCGGGGLQPKIIEETQYRIRKLTPKECWRLMDFSDEDFEKAADVNSNTQLYKQAGNSIVVNVLVAILGQLIPGKENAYKELSE